MLELVVSCVWYTAPLDVVWEEKEWGSNAVEKKCKILVKKI